VHSAPITHSEAVRVRFPPALCELRRTRSVCELRRKRAIQDVVPAHAGPHSHLRLLEQRVGWVERSDTHHFLNGDGFREGLNPSYVSIDFARRANHLRVFVTPESSPILKNISVLA